jgi:hypothetical protein
LAAELVAAELAIAEAIPEFFFNRRGLMPHGSCTFEKHRRDAMTGVEAHGCSRVYPLTPALSHEGRGRSTGHSRPSRIAVASLIARGMMRATSR